MMKNEPIIQEKPKRRKRTGRYRNLNLIIFVLVFLVLIVAIPYYMFVPKKESFKLQQYELATVSKRDFVKNVSAAGTVVASEKLAVKTRITGTVVGIFHQPGALVKQGDILLEIASEKLEADLDKAETEYQKKIKEQKKLALDHQRKIEEFVENIKEAEQAYLALQEKFPTWKKLYQIGEISKSQLESEEQKLKEAAKRIEGLKDNKKYTIEKYQIDQEDFGEIIAEFDRKVKELKEDLASCAIIADIDGKLISLAVKPGDNVQVGNTVAEIINEESLIVEGDVSQNVIDAIALGQKVDINVGSNQFVGEVTYIAAVAKDSKVNIIVSFNQVPLDIRPQTSVALDIQVGSYEDCLALPRGRYLSSGMERFVYRIEGDKAYKTDVSFGLINGNHVEVRSGLKLNDKIVISSYDNFIHLDQIDINPEGGLK